jgi:penicillin amidase
MLAVVTSAGVGYWFALQAVPDYDGIANVAELDQPVKVNYDQLGVPYIQGKSDRDVLIAQGYVTASERMFEMDMLRRAALGKLSEVYGSSCLVHDRLSHTLGFARLAHLQYESVSDTCKDNLKAYAAGVNAYLKQSAAHAPVEFILLGYRPTFWEPKDSLAIIAFLQYELDESWRLDEFQARMHAKVGAKLAGAMFAQSLRQVQAKPSEREIYNPQGGAKSKHAGSSPISLFDLGNHIGQMIVTPQSNWGSTAWAVSSSLSSTHGCLIACDKHGPFIWPDLWYSCSLQAANLHVAGATLPGAPGIIFGRNASIGWAVNSLKSDNQDLAIEEFSDKFSSKYRLGNNWSEAQELTEEIKQRFGPTIKHKITLTEHGPILFRNETTGIALNWLGFKAKGSAIETIWEIDRANSWSDFHSTLRQYRGSPNTFIYADSKGNIGLQVAGDIPDRRLEEENAAAAKSANDTVLPKQFGQWHERIKFEDLATSFNPTDGFLIANDVKHTGVPISSNPALAQRLREVLIQYRKTGQLLDLSSLSALQSDQQAYLLPLVRNELLKALEQTKNIDAFQQQALIIIHDSDGQLRGDSACAAIYESFMSTILRRVLLPKLEDQNLLNEYVQRFPTWTAFVAHILRDHPLELLPPEERDYQSFLLTSLAESLKNLRLEAKADDPKRFTWKSLHRLEPRLVGERLYPPALNLIVSLFAPFGLGVGGDQDCINNCNYEANGWPFSFDCQSGPTIRTVIDLSNPDCFFQSLTWGQSGHLLSNHRTDQLRSWLNCDPHAIAFSERQLEKQTQHTLILTNRYE